MEKPLLYDHITIGIIVRNEEKNLPRTLAYIFKQTYPLHQYAEIIIADGNSTDKTREVATELLASSGIAYKVCNERDFIDTEGVGYGHSRGRNVILMNAHQKSKYIAWIDGDCRADENWLMNLWMVIKHNKDRFIAGAGGTRFVETQGSYITRKELVLNYYFTSAIISLGNPAFTPRAHITYIPSVAGYNSIFKKEIYATYQYSSIFPFNTDDLEMNFRLAKDGYRFLYAKDAVIYHRGENTISGFLKQMKNYGKGVAYTMRLHSTPFVRIYAWIALGYVLYTVLLPLLIYLSFHYLDVAWYPVLPYVLLFVLGVFVFRENYRKTKTISSLYVLPTLFAHLWSYGVGVVEGLLEKKKTTRGKQ